MDRCFRAALGMFLLISCLQAAPTAPATTAQELELDFSELDKIHCADNVTFTYPPNIRPTKDCHAAAKKYFMAGLEHARANCTGDVGTIVSVLESLDRLEFLKDLTISSGCTFGTNETTYVNFVGEIISFVERLHN